MADVENQVAEVQQNGQTEENVDESAQPANIPPVTIRLPSPSHSRTLPKRSPPEDYSTLTLLPQPFETVQELKLTVNDWVGGYWLGPYSLRLPRKAEVNGDERGKSLGKGRDGAEVREGERLSEWLEVGDVFGHLGEGEERVLEVVKEPYSDFSARQSVLRLLELVYPAGTTAHHLTTPIALQPGTTIFESVRDGTINSISGQSAPVYEEVEVALPSGRKGKAGKKEVVKVKKEVTPDSKNAFADWKEWRTYGFGQIPLAQPEIEAQAPVKTLQLSPFNPPPAHLRQLGHQLYLQVSLIEGEVLTLVCSSRGWFASKSNVNSFDPSPRTELFHSLIDLLHSLSPQFSERLSHLTPLSTTPPPFEPLSTVPVPQAEPAYPWLAQVPKTACPPEILRTQLAYLHTGATTADALDASRDWNEELQGIKELPREHMQERVMREKMLQKTLAEFNQASLRAVLSVARGDIPPLNPNEDTRAHMWLLSNIFITKAIDSIDAYAHLGGDAAAFASHAKDAAGVKMLNKIDIDGINLLGHAVIDWQGERWVCQTMLPGIFSRRKDEDDWVKVDGADGVEKKEGADVDGKGDAEEKKEEETENPLIIYGLDSEHQTAIHWDEPTHRVMEKVAAVYRLAAHKVKDGKGQEREFYASAEVKGLRGTDGRRYLLDLPRLSPVDIEWLENDIEGYPHRVVLLRPELIETFWESELKRTARELAAKAKEGKEAKDASAAAADREESKEGKEDGDEKEKEDDKLDEALTAELQKFDLRFNPDAFVDQPRPKGSEETGFVPSTMTDESDPSIKAVRDASAFLRSVAIPAIALDSLTGNISGVMDGVSLTRHLHGRGINMRYLGHLATRITKFSAGTDGEKTEVGHLTSLKRIVLQEMVFRASKHILRQLVQGLQPEHIPCAVSHFLNCLLGFNPSPKAVYKPLDFAQSPEPLYVSITPESLRKQVVSEVQTRYRYELDEEYLVSGLRKRQLLREIASRFAFQLQQRDYQFEKSDATSEDETSRKDKDKKKAPKSAPRESTFELADILTMIPVLKSTAPAVTIAQEIIETGRSTINRGNTELGLEFMLEAIQLYENIHSVIHPEVAAAYDKYATTLHQLARIKFQQFAQEGQDPEQPLGLDIATGLRLQRQAIIIAERTLGVYHPETAGYYFNLAMLENLEGNGQASLRYFRHGLMLWDIIHGPDHPEINTLLSNAGVVLQAMGENNTSLHLLTLASDLTTRQFGAEHLTTAQSLHQLTQAKFLVGDIPGAFTTSQQAYDIFKARLGEEHAQTKEVGRNVELLKAVVENVERQKAANEAQKKAQAERLHAAQARVGGLARFRRLGAGATTANGAGASSVNGNGDGVVAAAKAESSASGAAAAAVEADADAENSRIGERGHLDVDELVKFIQGGGASVGGAGGKGNRGKNALRGKRRTGAKR